MRITVLAGGLSPERDVSLSSGSLIANALIENGHSVAFVDLYRGCDAPNGFDALFFDKASGKKFAYTVPKAEPDLDALRCECDNNGAFIGKNVLALCGYSDLAFIALHGDIGENGQLQAAFDVYGIRYTGTGYAGSLLAMDKDIAKRLMRQSQIPTADWVYLDLANGSITDAAEAIGFPCVIKPASCGSSVGVSIIHDKAALDKAVAYAKKYEDFVIVEQLIQGREFSVGVVGGAAMPIIEIVPNEGFYDYANKYQAGAAREICPADLPEQITKAMQASALQVHKALRLGFYSRVDFMLDKDGKFFCLEANTLPGMTPTSLLPQEASAAGISYNELCERIVRAGREG